jgi:hypothetical protein
MKHADLRKALAALQDRDGNTVQLHWKYALGSDEPATTQTWSARYAAGQGAAPATQGKPPAPFARPLLAGLSDTAGRRLHLHWSAPGTLPLDAFAGARLTAVVLHAAEHAPQTLAQYAYDAQGNKTGRAVIVHEAVRSFGVGAEIAATINEELFGKLKAPVRRLGAPYSPVPFLLSKNTPLR